MQGAQQTHPTGFFNEGRPAAAAAAAAPLAGAVAAVPVPVEEAVLAAWLTAASRETAFEAPNALPLPPELCNERTGVEWED